MLEGDELNIPKFLEMLFHLAPSHLAPKISDENGRRRWQIVAFNAQENWKKQQMCIET